jgi:hypothetical protein
MSEDYVKILILVGLQRGQAPLPDLFFDKALDSNKILGMNKSGRGACPRFSWL